MNSSILAALCHILPVLSELFQGTIGFLVADCCCSPFLSLPCPRHLPKPAPMFCRITA
ncbi:hypothetical protein [Pectinatus brassicae]|uniref:Uncharacterized protein n=1 Tax=Pectinatus brassicae TaxID=862415 RepID=A0A840UX39_9FIRM|nr:hypothetical protein [Pectinatus brassicae]MBB5337433.1 hypothetical protein [Pectinatus brassicae]